MSAAHESNDWYRAAHLKPQIPQRVDVSRQVFRGVTWRVLRDPVSGKFTRLNENAYFLISLMDGRRTLSDIWDMACAELGDDAPSQADLLGTVAQLSLLDMLKTDGQPNAAGLVAKGARVRRMTGLTRFLNPLSIRVPLFDPDKMVTALWPFARPMFSLWGALGVVALLLAGLVTAAMNWGPLTENLVDRVTATQSLLILVLVYPVVKAFHELGHGLAVKKWGGEVRDVGLIFIVFMPIPYVDASSATGFQSKWSRALVGAMGIIVELSLAAAAMLIWTQLEEGLVRAICFNIMLIGGISTLLFNGNPLLRFDGYYVFSDLVEMPSLGPRSNKYLGYLIQKYAFGLKSARSSAQHPSERPWLVAYALMSFVYRIFISFAIVMLVASKFFIFGVLLAIWAVLLMFGLPLVKHFRFLTSSPTLQEKRGRALAVSGGAAAVLVFLIGLLPLPYRTVAEGIVYVPDNAVVYAGEAGHVGEVLARNQAMVTEGDDIVQLSDPFIDVELDAAIADARKFALRYQQALNENAFDVRLWRTQAERSEAEVEILRGRKEGLTLRANTSGRLVLPEQNDLAGRFLNKGDVIGYLVRPESVVVRVAVAQADADLIRRRTKSVLLRPTENLSRIISGEIVREAPLVGGDLASLALSSEGGGRFMLDPRGSEGPRSFDRVMHFDIAPSETTSQVALGSRVYVRFDHGSEPLIGRVSRGFRQLFLRQLNV